MGGGTGHLYRWLCSATCLPKHWLPLMDSADSREPYLDRASTFSPPFLTSP